jgi:hypothetical protein
VSKERCKHKAAFPLPAYDDQCVQEEGHEGQHTFVVQYAANAAWPPVARDGDPGAETEDAMFTALRAQAIREAREAIPSTLCAMVREHGGAAIITPTHCFYVATLDDDVDPIGFKVLPYAGPYAVPSVEIEHA